jgi:hypothetical protein
LKQTNPDLAERCLKRIDRSIQSVKEYLTKERAFEEIAGLKLPAWLPYKYAADQASVLIMCLSNYYNFTEDSSVLEYVELLADGIMLMQVREDESKYYGAILSWMNTWHAWGNLQSYALLAAHRITGSKEQLASALLEIDNFYKYQYEKKYISFFEVSKTDNYLESSGEQIYSQIAYGIRPMVYAALEAFKITGEKKYAVLAAECGSWFFGINLQNEQMYFPETGICYDGMSEDGINKNSGAESTIEALLALQEIEQNDIVFSKLISLINDEENKTR